MNQAKGADREVANESHADSVRLDADRAPAPRRSVLRRLAHLNEIGVIVAFLGLVAIVGVFRPAFLGIDSLVNVGQQAAPYGMMALGMVFLLSMKEIDLSVGAVYALSIMIAALLMSAGLDPWLSVIGGLAVGPACGAINGALTKTLRISTIVATLGTLSVFRGLTLVLSDGRYISGLPREHSFFSIFSGSFLAVPAGFWVFVLAAIGLGGLYRFTRVGFVIKAVGSNDRAAHLAGMRIPRIRLWTLMLVGLLCSISGMMTLAFFRSADSNLGVGYELLAIAAAIIGGTGLSGGRGSVEGAFFGALVISVIRSGLIQFGVTANWSSFATGLVIILAVAADAFIRRKQAEDLDLL